MVARLGAETFTILAGLTVIRWIVKTKSKNEFNEQVSYQQIESGHPMLEICKFCQIIKNRSDCCYEDDLVFAFKNICSVAKEHYLVCPKTHIKDVSSLNASHKDILTRMQKVASKLTQGSLNVKVIDEDAANTSLNGFHKPLSTSVDHLHLHVFSLPFKSCFTAYWKFYNPLFFVTLDDVLKRLN